MQETYVYLKVLAKLIRGRESRKNPYQWSTVVDRRRPSPVLLCIDLVMNICKDLKMTFCCP